MSKTVIKVEHLSKQYRLGQVGRGTLANDLNSWWHRIRGKEDPYLNIGEENDRSRKGKSDLVWALKDINFEVKEGEVLGIIGKNGAGKSTLLKILSRTTSPTKGSYKVKGRIASLLEVGTGFHPDLSGRENVFLNGAILGMTKKEISRKFDEIIAFSGVERYIDTPVKRYSSGMYVRLAFAVAAHLDPEILIVDEVLAVGDSEFQKKCLGKMKDVSGQGRTVLFVSHDMGAVRSLCETAIFLKNGMIYRKGKVEEVVNDYLTEGLKSNEVGLIPDNASVINTGEVKYKSIKILNDKKEIINTLFYFQSFTIVVEVEILKKVNQLILDFSIGSFDRKIVYSSTFDINQEALELEKGTHKFTIRIPNKFMPGNYSFYLGAHEYGGDVKTCDYLEQIYDFTVLKNSENGLIKYPFDVVFGNVNEVADWQHEQIN